MDLWLTSYEQSIMSVYGVDLMKRPDLVNRTLLASCKTQLKII